MLSRDSFQQFTSGCGHRPLKEPPSWTTDSLPVSFVGFCLYQILNGIVSYNFILAFFYLHSLVKLFYFISHMGFNTIYISMTLKLISTAKSLP